MARAALPMGHCSASAAIKAVITLVITAHMTGGSVMEQMVVTAVMALAETLAAEATQAEVEEMVAAAIEPAALWPRSLLRRSLKRTSAHLQTGLSEISLSARSGRSTESERESLRAAVKKLDLEAVICNRAMLADELIEAL